MSSEYPDYDGALENRSGRDTSQPNGVSEDSRNEGWSHRSKMETVDNEKRKSISQRVEENRVGKTHHPNLGEEENPSEKHPDHDEKETSQKYREKYSKYWSDETKEKAKKLYKERGDE